MLVMPTGATRISSRMTYYYKRIFPVMLFGVGGIVLLGMISTNWGPRGVPVMGYMVPILVMLVGYLLYRALLSDLVDEVWDNGADLIVVNEAHAEPIALRDIVNVSYSGFTNPKRATLQLRSAGRWGNKLSFIPLRSTVSMFDLLNNPMVDDLIRRVDEARRRA